MTAGKRVKLLLAALLLIFTSTSCLSGGDHQGFSTGEGYSDVDSTDMETLTDFYTNGGTAPGTQLVK